MRIQSLAENTQSFFNGVIFGAPGVGKTSVTCTDTAKVFVFNVDKSLNAAKQRRKELDLPFDHIKYADINSVNDFDEASEWFNKNIRQFNRVVIDSATELQRMIIRETCATNKVVVPGWDEWNVVRQITERLLVEFRELPIDVVYTAHETNKKGQWRPAFDGEFKTDYARHVDYICRYVMVWSNIKTEENPTGTDTLVRSLQFGPHPLTETKDRSRAMGHWENPDLDNILMRMRQAVALTETA